MKKGVLILLVLIILGGVAVGVYFGTQKKEDDDEGTEIESTGTKPKPKDEPKKVPQPKGLYTIEQGIRHQGNNPADGKTEDLWYHSNHGGSWNKYYKFACVDSDGKESEKVGPYGPISFFSYGSPTIRFAPKGTKPCGENTVTIYRGDSKDGEYSVIGTGIKNAIAGG